MIQLATPHRLAREVPTEPTAPRASRDTLTSLDGGNHLSYSSPPFGHPLQRMRVELDSHAPTPSTILISSAVRPYSS